MKERAKAQLFDGRLGVFVRTPAASDGDERSSSV